MKALTMADIIAKRKKIWEERHDIDYDKQLINATAVKILSTESLREEVKEKPYLLIESVFYIVDKDKKTVPFFFNSVQQDFIAQIETKGRNKPYFVLKGRQQGFTSLITAIQLSYSIVMRNFSGFTMADRTDNTSAIFNDKARVSYDRLPELLKPSEKFNSRNELFFDKLNSSWRIATATDQVGRSRTLNFVHLSEIAFYECDLSSLQAGIGEATTPNALIIYETTANGFNQAKDLWDLGSCCNLFYEWWQTPEYRSNEYQYLETTDSWLLERIKVLQERGCDKEQITWYCKKYESYIDKSLIRQEYPITPEEAFVSSGYGIFDNELINNQIARVSHLQAVKTGYFGYKKVCKPIYDEDGKQVDVEWSLTDIEFIESKDGYITIHEEPRIKTDDNGNVVAKAPYVIGCDTAGSGQDYFTAKVIDNITDKTVATLHKQRIDEDIYAEQVYCLGKYYHDALIGVEINYSREPIRVLSKVYSYPNLYMRETVDGLTDEVKLEYGFATTPKTKPIILSELVALVRSKPTIEVDLDTLKEMTTFVKKDNGKQEAMNGCHDDLVMALAIGHFISKKQTNDWVKIESTEKDFIQQNFSVEEESGNANYMEWDEF